jgi:two-component system LytT family sensor kinase
MLQTFVLHRLGLAWHISLTDAAISNALLAIAGYVTENAYRYYRPRSRNILQHLGWSLALTFVCMLALSFILSQLYAGNIIYLNFLSVSMPLRYMFSLLMIAFITVVSWLWFYVKEQEENTKRKEEAERLLRDAELSKLHQQLQPHFLFNSLNSISALAGTKPEEARKMIQQLSDFLRGTLKKDEQQMVNLKEELQLLDLYLQIEKVRFGHRLHTIVSSEEGSLTMKLPSLLLQPLVENAIKFGLYDTIGEITISIIAKAENKSLIIEIKNPFDPQSSKPKQGTGFGLSSVQRRLYLTYARQDLLITEQQEGSFITTLKIPQLQ